MWCYQKPGFKALLLTELQRQQQCRHFCDTMLKTEDISVPAHSCILSAISPHIASALSSTPSPPPGQSRLLEFQALGAHTLLRVVRLMYSGEMVGEGEKEKQEAVSAAAKLGIHGLVEVTAKHGENSQWVEVGVQTEPLLEKEKREGKWVRDVRNGSTIMWKKRLSGDIKDMWTQTEQLQVNTVAPESTYETIDVSCLQNLRHTDSSVIPFIPISLLYPPNENQLPQPSFAPMSSLQESSVAGPSCAVLDPPPSFSSLFSRETASIIHPQSRRTSSQVAAGNEWDDSSFERFKGNISGYINDFLNPEKQEKQTHRVQQKGRRQRSGARGTQRAGTGERIPRRPPARAAGSGRGGFTQTVDVQEVGLSAAQKLFLQRWSTTSSRTGQGGGAAGRKLYLKTREQLPKRRSRGSEKMSKASLNKDDAPLNERGRARAEGCIKAQFQDGFQPSSEEAKPADGFLSPPGRFYNLRTAPASTPSLHPSPSPGLWSSAGSYVSPASSLLHNPAVPPPPQDEQVEQINRLLEEVMMGLDIFPNSSTQPAPPAGSSSCTYSICTSAENRQHGHAFVKEGARSGSANNKGPVPQQQGETEFREMLENFFSSFEPEIQGCSAAEGETVGRSQTRALAGSSQAASQQLERRKTPIRSRLRKASASSATRSLRTTNRKESPAKKPRKTRGRKKRMPPQQRLKDLGRCSDLDIRKLQKEENQQLKQMPVVKLERRGPLPDTLILHGKGLPNLNIDKSVKTESSSGRCPGAGKSQTVEMAKKVYPIRSKLKEARVDSTLWLEQPLKQHRCRRGRSKGRPQNGNALDFSAKVQPGEQLCTQDRLQKISDPPEGEKRGQPRKHACKAPRKVSRRKAEVEEQQREDASRSKRVCLEPRSHTTSPSPPQPKGSKCEPAAREVEEEVIDVETLSPSGADGSQEGKPEWKEITPREAEELEHSSCDEVIVVDGDGEDENIDVLEGSSLGSHQMSIPWSEALKYQEEEEEEIDVVSEQSLHPSTAVWAT